MERKIGEIFNYDGEWYQCAGGTCRSCSFYYDTACKNIDTIGKTVIGNCHCSLREDHKNVIFKKLEKVGEPYTTFVDKTVQNYLLEIAVSVPPKDVFTLINNEQRIIAIEIKQNKEDMETIISKDATKHSNSENIGKNLKPFDLNLAKQGKPICTRDGRKARIICFDRKDIKPIVALVTVVNDTSVTEKALYYFEDGHHLSKNYDDINDLIMLPEKKEGWVNVYKEPEGEYYVDKLIHKTEKFAFDVACPDDYIGTVKIEWYE